MKKNPNPNNKLIVLIGCPNFVVQPNAFKSQPKSIDPVEINTLFRLVKLFQLVYRYDAYIPGLFTVNRGQ